MPRLPARLPRAVFWITGATVVPGGAAAARLLAERASGEYRLLIWLAGAAAIFLGLAVLSLGTRSRLGTNDSDRRG